MPEPELPSLFDVTPRRWAVAGGGKTMRLGEEETGIVPEVESRSGGAGATDGLALFAQGTAADGYERWKAESAQARAVEEAARRAGELPTQGDDAGYAAWKSEAEAAKRAFEQRWGVPLGKPVRVQLRDEAREREGLLRMVEELGSGGKTLRLRLGTEVFEAGRIESLVRLD